MLFQDYQKKPVDVLALQYTNTEEMNQKLIQYITSKGQEAYVTTEVRNCSPKHPEGFDYPVLKIKTLEGDMSVSEGDWIIQGTQGEFYPIKPKIFEDCYGISNTNIGVHVEENEKRVKEDRNLSPELFEHLKSVMYCLSGALEDHNQRNYGDRDNWFRHINNSWEEFTNEHSESLNPLEYIDSLKKVRHLNYKTEHVCYYKGFEISSSYDTFGAEYSEYSAPTKELYDKVSNYETQSLISLINIIDTHLSE